MPADEQRREIACVSCSGSGRVCNIYKRMMVTCVSCGGSKVETRPDVLARLPKRELSSSIANAALNAAYNDGWNDALKSVRKAIDERYAPPSSALPTESK